MAPYEARIGPLQGLGLVRTPTADMIRLRRQFRYDSHLVLIRWLLELLDYCIDFSLFLNHVSLFNISPLLLLGGFPLYIFGSIHKYFFTNEYVRSLLEPLISCPHRCVNILTIESSKESIN